MPYTKENILNLLWDHSTEKDSGRTVYFGWVPGGRLNYDFKHCNGGGWMQFDTDQDAPYFGMWVNPQELVTLTYAEGDLTAVICADKESYNREIADACKFYDESPAFTVIDAGTITDYYQDRKEFFIK